MRLLFLLLTLFLTTNAFLQSQDFATVPSHKFEKDTSFSKFTYFSSSLLERWNYLEIRSPLISKVFSDDVLLFEWKRSAEYESDFVVFTLHDAKGKLVLYKEINSDSIKVFLEALRLSPDELYYWNARIKVKELSISYQGSIYVSPISQKSFTYDKFSLYEKMLSIEGVRNSELLNYLKGNYLHELNYNFLALEYLKRLKKTSSEHILEAFISKTSQYRK